MFVVLGGQGREGFPEEEHCVHIARKYSMLLIPGGHESDGSVSMLLTDVPAERTVTIDDYVVNFHY